MRHGCSGQPIILALRLRDTHRLAHLGPTPGAVASPGPADMWVGSIEFDLLLGEVGSLKEKRSLVRPLIAELRRTYQLSVAEVGHLDLHRRAGIGIAAASGDHAHLIQILDAVERSVAARPESELLSARRIIRNTDD